MEIVPNKSMLPKLANYWWMDEPISNLEAIEKEYKMRARTHIEYPYVKLWRPLYLWNADTSRAVLNWLSAVSEAGPQERQSICNALNSLIIY